MFIILMLLLTFTTGLSLAEAVRIANDMVTEELIDSHTAVMRVAPQQLDHGRPGEEQLQGLALHEDTGRASWLSRLNRLFQIGQPSFTDLEFEEAVRARA